MSSVWKHPKSKFWSACYTLPNRKRVKESTKLTNEATAKRLARFLEAVAPRIQIENDSGKLAVTLQAEYGMTPRFAAELAETLCARVRADPSAQRGLVTRETVRALAVFPHEQNTNAPNNSPAFLTLRGYVKTKSKASARQKSALSAPATPPEKTASPIIAVKTPAVDSDWVRLPKHGETLFGLSRSYLFQLCVGKKIRSITTKAADSKRGVRLIYAPSVLAMFSALDAEQNAEMEGAK